MTEEVKLRSPRDRIALAAKVLWLITIIGFATWYILSNWEEIGSYAAALSVPQILGSIVGVIVGRVLLAAISRLALEVYGASVTVSISFWINAVSQLGKYIPGSVWHFVGRIALYRRQGVSVSAGSRVLLVENSALFVSGGFLGLVPLADLFFRSRPTSGGAGIPTLALVVTAALTLWWLTVTYVPRLIARRFSDLERLPKLQLYWLCVGLWASFGLAFWALSPPESLTVQMLPLAIGAFSLAWIAGNIAPFAPAGIGVREAVIVALLGPHLGVGVAVGMAASSRLIWTVAELGVAPLASYKLERAHHGTS